ncbi:MAG TPA: hypothetical protein VEO54_29145 [Thermoanaerobaculia bacterium]|nr:hypothetical protein [Thermoanaerobaculia bacterium]
MTITTAQPVVARIVRVGVLSAISKLDPREAVDNISGMVLAAMVYGASNTCPAARAAGGSAQ